MIGKMIGKIIIERANYTESRNTSNTADM